MGRHLKKINKHYFDRKKRNEKQKRDFYYILGAWYSSGLCCKKKNKKTDGSKYSYRYVTFQNRSKELVQIVIDELEYEGDPKYHKSEKAKDRSSYWFNANAGDTLCDRLEELGAVSKDKRKFPEMPVKYLRHFVRGFLDAQARFSRENILLIRFNSKFIKGLREVLEKYAHVEGGGDKKNQLTYSVADIAKIYDFIYEEELYLPDKKKQMISNKEEQMKKVHARLERAEKFKQQLKERLYKAAKVLRDGGTIAEAASAANCAHFSGLYKPFRIYMKETQGTEMTPGEYRDAYARKARK